MSKIKLITDANELAKEGKLIANQVGAKGTVAKRIQRFLLSEIAHIEEHRNPTRLNTFLEGVKGGAVRVAAIKSYVLAFANVEPETEVKGNKVRETGRLVMRKARSEAEFNEKFAKATATDWLSFKPETTETIYDREMLVKDVTKLLSKAMAEGFTDKDIADIVGETAATARATAKKVMARKAGKQAEAKVLAEA